MVMKCQICRKFIGIVFKKHKLNDGRIVCNNCFESIQENHQSHELLKNNVCKYCNKKIHNVSKGWS